MSRDFETEAIFAGAWFDARYPGECSNCEQGWSKGQRIRKGVSGDYECCEPPDEEQEFDIVNGDGDVVRRINYTICGQCQCVKPCFCD